MGRGNGGFKENGYVDRYQKDYLSKYRGRGEQTIF